MHAQQAQQDDTTATNGCVPPFCMLNISNSSKPCRTILVWIQEEVKAFTCCIVTGPFPDFSRSSTGDGLHGTSLSDIGSADGRGGSSSGHSGKSSGDGN